AGARIRPRVTSVGSSRRPPEFHQHSTTFSLNPRSRPRPRQRDASGAWRRTHGIRDQGPLKSGRNLEGQWCLELSMFLGLEGNSEHRPPFPGSNRRPTPSGIPAIQYLTYSQNVAGLWLKYGAKPQNKGVLGPSRNLHPV